MRSHALFSCALHCYLLTMNDKKEKKLVRCSSVETVSVFTNYDLFAAGLERDLHDKSRFQI